MSRVIVTANGNAIDMESLRLQNEKTVSVGNMRVNARGDEISPTTGEIVKTREQRMSEYYKLHSTVPTKKNRSKREKTVTAEQIAPVAETTESVDQEDINADS
jgi:hypothetical protein